MVCLPLGLLVACHFYFSGQAKYVFHLKEQAIQNNNISSSFFFLLKKEKKKKKKEITIHVLMSHNFYRAQQQNGNIDIVGIIG